MEQHTEEIHKKSWYDKSYKILAIIPIILVVLSLIYLFNFYSKNNDLMYKDVSLSGGTTITLKGDIDSNKLETELKLKFIDINFRKLTDIRTGKPIAFIIESSSSSEELKGEIEKSLGYKLNDENSSTEFTGPILSQSFYRELLKVVFISFVLMALVIFIIFGESKLIKAVSAAISFSAVKLTFPAKPSVTVIAFIVGVVAIVYCLTKVKIKKDYYYVIIAALILLISLVFPKYYLMFPIVLILFLMYLSESLPSIAVIFAAFSDIVFALVIVDFMEIKLSAAGIAAFLMLIGYSVDTDILLTSRALKRGE